MPKMPQRIQQNIPIRMAKTKMPKMWLKESCYDWTLLGDERNGTEKRLNWKLAMRTGKRKAYL